MAVKSQNQSRDEFCSALLQRMTLEEKIGQMVQSDLTWKQDIKQFLREGRIGSLLSVRSVHTINEYQHIAVTESRLGIPVLVGNDVIHGYRALFPIPLGLASTWNSHLVEEVARVSMAEAVPNGTTWNYTPMVDISRDPRWGRIAESGGEDPYLNSQMARAWVTGSQAYRDGEGHHVAACVKHYAAYGGAESGKDYNTVDMSERRLREEYLPPYRAAVEAGVKTVMTSFNDLNGVPATANQHLMREILREEWGFDGVLVSDYDAIGELILHGAARDHKEAALRALKAGVDIDMMGNAYPFHLAELVKEGAVSEAEIDASVLRILDLKYDLGLFERPYFDEDIAATSLMQPAMLELAEKAATESLVLLKNEGSVLPLAAKAQTIALIGPLAEERSSLMGCWSFNGRPDDEETLHEALQRNLPAGAQLLTVAGCSIDGQDLDLDSALAAAEKADVVLLAVGERETMSGEAHSRAHLNLPGRQEELVKAVTVLGKPVVAVIFCGRPLVLTELAAAVPALLLAYHGGTRAAQAVCNVLFGKANPAGKLTASFPRSLGQIPVYYAHKSTGRPAGSVGTIQFNQAHRSAYLDESNEPLFPFGFGLSYTHFVYSDLQVATPKVERKGVLKVSVWVENAGSMAGQEIVQLYVRDLVGVVTRPVKELKGFQKISLQPGEKHQVTFELPVSALTFLDVDLHPILESGDFKVWIGPNSSEGLEGSFTL